MRLVRCLLIFVTVTACDDSSISLNSIEYFRKYLKEDMNYSDLRSRFGRPDADIGSGIHIYVYNLDDGTQVTIGFTDKVIYARHINETDLLEELI
jgi:hypothetical protein